MAVLLRDDANFAPTVPLPQVPSFTMAVFSYRILKNQCRPMNWGENMIEIETGSNNDWRGRHYNSGAYSSITSPSGVVPEGFWYHLMFTHTDGAQEIYRDGRYNDASGTFANDATYSFSDPRLPGDSASRNYVGLAAEFAIWNRPLTSDEALKIGHHRASPLYFPDGLILYSPCIDTHYDLITGQPVDTGPHGVIGGSHPGGIDYPPSSGLRRRAAYLSALIDADAAPGAIAGHL